MGGDSAKPPPWLKGGRTLILWLFFSKFSPNLFYSVLVNLYLLPGQVLKVKNRFFQCIF